MVFIMESAKEAITPGTRILQLRTEKRYTREQLAYMAEISEKFLYEIEFGKKGFSVSILKSIADSLETSCEYIVRGDDIYSDTELYNAVRLFEGREADKVAEVLKALHEPVW